MKNRSNNDIINYLKEKINNSWYKKEFENFGVNGHYLKSKYNERNDELLIYHEEDGIKYETRIVYISEYTLNQIYEIWKDNLWVNII